MKERSAEQMSYDCLAGGGEMGGLMRSHDWAATPFGPVETWPQSLRTAISLMLASRFAMVIAWGPGRGTLLRVGQGPGKQRLTVKQRFHRTMRLRHPPGPRPPASGP